MVKRNTMPTIRPTANENTTPGTEFQDSTTSRMASIYSMFQLHFTAERMRRGPAMVRKAANPA